MPLYMNPKAEILSTTMILGWYEIYLLLVFLPFIPASSAAKYPLLFTSLTPLVLFSLTPTNISRHTVNIYFRRFHFLSLCPQFVRLAARSS